MQLYCGIDLGTTNSTVSVIQTKERRLKNPMESLRTIPIRQYDINYNITNERITLPSYFYCKPEQNKIYTGEYAKMMYATGNRPMNTFTGVKTRLGGESFIEIPNGEKDNVIFNMTECSAILLKTIKQSIEEQFDQPIDYLVVTVPAAFNSDERQATKEAILLAGYENFHLLDEPAATLLYYLNDGDGSLVQAETEIDGKHVMVYDIGGGTLDICIAQVNYNDDDFEIDKIDVDIKSRSKRVDLGGNDFDQYLGSYFLSEFEKCNEHISSRSKDDQARIISRIVSNAERYKIDLNNKVKEYIDNPRRLKRLVISPEFELIDNQFVQGINLDKETLEDVFEPLITESQYTNIIKPVKECLMSAENLTKDDIALVIITGGMSNFYIVEEKLNEFFEGKVPVVTVDTTTSVSKGAAIDAYNAIDSNISLRKMDIKDRLAEDIYLRDSKGFKLLISRHQLNENIVTGEFDYVIDEDNLLKVPVFLYYGQDINCVEDFTPIQGKMISLSRQYKKGDILKLKWHMDKSQVIRISIEELGTEIVFEDNCSGKVQGRKDYINQFSIN